MVVAVSAGCCGIGRHLYRRLQDEAAVRHRRLERRNRPAYERIAHVAAAAPLHDLAALDVDDIDGGNGVFEFPRLDVDQAAQVPGARAHERISHAKCAGARRAARFERAVEVAQAVFRLGNVAARAHAGRPERRVVGHADRPQPQPGVDDPQAEAVADVERRVGCHTEAQPVASGEAAAAVIERQVDIGSLRRRDLDDQIRVPGLGARLERRLWLDAGEIGHEQDRALERRAVDDGVLAHLAQQPADAAL